MVYRKHIFSFYIWLCLATGFGIWDILRRCLSNLRFDDLFHFHLDLVVHSPRPSGPRIVWVAGRVDKVGKLIQRQGSPGCHTWVYIGVDHFCVALSIVCWLFPGRLACGRRQLGCEEWSLYTKIGFGPVLCVIPTAVTFKRCEPICAYRLI